MKSILNIEIVTIEHFPDAPDFAKQSWVVDWRALKHKRKR